MKKNLLRTDKEVFAMKVNLHAHTVRCNHASGTEREYIENAVKAGFTRYGFADHAPYVFKDGYYSNFRMKPEQQEDYVNTLLALKEEYKDVIDIRIGYEAEYYPEFFGDFLKLAARFHVDYLILGQHFMENEMTRKYSGIRTEDEGYLSQYVDQYIAGMKTGVFTYGAHPDLVHFVGSDALFDRHYGRLIEAAKELKVPMEINFLGIRDHRTYPHDRFFKLCGEIGAEVCFGCDAHSADVAVDAASEARALEMVEQYGLILNESPELRPVPASL